MTNYRSNSLTMQNFVGKNRHINSIFIGFHTFLTTLVHIECAEGIDSSERAANKILLQFILD